MSDEPEQDLRGYQAYWRRIARHVSLSDAGKHLGIRASQLSAFERGGAHDLNDDQIAAYLTWLDSLPVDIPAEDPPPPVDEDEPTA